MRRRTPLVDRVVMAVGATVLAAPIVGSGAAAFSRSVGLDDAAAGIVVGLTLAVALGVAIRRGASG